MPFFVLHVDMIDLGLCFSWSRHTSAVVVHGLVLKRHVHRLKCV